MWNDGTSLYHYGIKGQHWGQRRYQEYDGSLTNEGYRHYGYGRAAVRRGPHANIPLNVRGAGVIEADGRVIRKPTTSAPSKSGDIYVTNKNGERVRFSKTGAVAEKKRVKRSSLPFNIEEIKNVETTNKKREETPAQTKPPVTTVSSKPLSEETTDKVRSELERRRNEKTTSDNSVVSNLPHSRERSETKGTVDVKVGESANINQVGTRYTREYINAGKEYLRRRWR